MDATEALSNFERFVNILETGGGWAVAALFFLLYLRSDRRYARAMEDLKDIAVAKVESDVKTERTLDAGNAAMDGVKARLDGMKSSISELTNVLKQILLLKNQRLADGAKPNGDDS